MGSQAAALRSLRQHPAGRLLRLLTVAALAAVASAQSDAGIPMFSVSHRGVSLQVIQLGSINFVEPLIAFQAGTCLSVTYDYFYNRYSLRVPLIVDFATLPGGVPFVPRDVRTALTFSDNPMVVRLDKPTAATLTVWCPSHDRCEQLRWTLLNEPQALADSFLMAVTGGAGDKLVTLNYRKLHTLPAPGPYACDSSWTVFQRRLDASLPFQQNWDTYARGFGHPDSNYWMGLEQLSTKTKGSLFYANCRLRIEVETVTGQLLWAEYAQFRVREYDDKYRLNVTDPVGSGTLDPGAMGHENGMQFSTYDNHDNDGTGAQFCSKDHANAGWWFNSCYSIFLNGFYTDKVIPNDYNNMNQVHQFGTWILIARTKMMYKCI